MKQRPYPTPPPMHQQPYIPPPRPDCAATLPLPRMTSRRLLWQRLRRAETLIHAGCALMISGGAVTLNTTRPSTAAWIVGIVFVITGSGTSGYHLKKGTP